ncbi:vWA domain-containing protein [Lysobacter zhanggongensis]|uniref:VWA domain-containing protein n=1 Tax=Lysobacter zhanggongensis TaxID=1774951 RepID=A0ABU7YSN4_9GAMM
MHRPHARTTTLAAALLAAIAVAACSTTHESPVADETGRVAQAERASQAQDAQAARRPPAHPAPASLHMVAPAGMPAFAPPQANTEHYAGLDDNPVHRVSDQPVSTFSVDVDTGSYSNVRRMLLDGVRPPVDAVRAEEFINYFDYGHPAPSGTDVPFGITTELAPAPWNAERRLLMIGIKGYDIPRADLPPSNLVLLIDTSGSMNSPDKLPLLKRAMGMLVRQLRPQDTVSIVVYAGSAGLVLPPTPGNRQGEILAALSQLEAGGSTNGGDGIRLAYDMARQGFIEGGTNRVLLATDGDFNVGTVDQGALETLVADQRASGIALTTLGFGQGNYNDALAERLADLGNGNHAYIDSALEARRVLVEAMGSTLATIASDVKVQVEFNPAVVAEYRLVGYENRVLRNEDFANDKVDAGDIGAGHSVTALYELTLAGSPAVRLPGLRYGDTNPTTASDSREVAHVRLRYKQPGTDTSRLVETPVLRDQLRAQPGESMRFAAAVAGFADLLRGGARTDGWGWDGVLATARSAQGGPGQGMRAEFVELVELARPLVEPRPVAGGGLDASDARPSQPGVAAGD